MNPYTPIFACRPGTGTASHLGQRRTDNFDAVETAVGHEVREQGM